MTKNQIEYNKLLESRRSNLANEQLTEKRDRLAHEVNIGNLRRQERYDSASLDEQSRAHRVTEGIEAAKAGIQAQLASETARSNRAKEEQNFISYLETLRSNSAREYETNRSNVASEGLRASDIASAIALGTQRNEETHRSNVASETIKKSQLQQDKNLAIASNRIKAEQNRLSAQRLDQEARNASRTQSIAASNLQLGYNQLMEKHRSSVVSENETQRHNRASESIQNQNVLIGRTNAETNKKNASTNRMNATTNIITGAARTATSIFLH